MEYKKEYKDENGKNLLIVNISLPEINGNTALKENTSRLYSGIKDSFLKFCEKKLLKKAEKHSHDGGFKAFSGVVKHNVTFENEKHISVFTDAFVFSSYGKSKTVRLGQIWNKADGRLMNFYDFFARSDKEKLVAMFAAQAQGRQKNGSTEYVDKYKARIENNSSFNDFYLTKNGYAFFYPSLCLTQNKTPEVFIIKYNADKFM